MLFFNILQKAFKFKRLVINMNMLKNKSLHNSTIPHAVALLSASKKTPKYQ
jgi:hypothetical protein